MERWFCCKIAKLPLSKTDGENNISCSEKLS